MRARRLSTIQHLIAPPVPSLLFVGGDEALATRVQRELLAARMANPLVVASTCAEALALLVGDADSELVLSPFVIVLWEGAPQAVDFVRQLRGIDGLHDAVIFVLASSAAASPAAFHHLRVAGYLPDGLGGDWAGLLRNYLRVVTLPDAMDHQLARRTV